VFRVAGELLPHGRFLFQIFIIGDIRNLEPAGEAAAADLGQNHAVVGIGGMDDLTVPDIYPDVTLMPESQTRRFGERIDRAFLRCIFVHGVRTDIGHTVCTVCDTAAFTVVPAVVLNQSDAVRSPSAEPVCLDKVCLAADLIGVLLGFRVQRFLSKHLTVGSPYNVLLQYFFVVEWLVDGIEQGELAERPGENGRKAYEYTLEKSNGEEAGIRPAFLACYTYGLADSPMETVPEEFKSALSGDAAYRAWASGQNDAAISLRNDQEKVKFASLAGEDSGLVYDDFVNEAVRSGRSRVDVNEENRTYLSAETAEQINETAKALGLRVQFTDSVRGGTANAQISGDTILIEKDNPNPVLAIAGHEFGHRLQELAPEEYRRFRESILEGREQEVRDKAAQYAKLGVNVTYEEAMNEVANDQAGLLMDGGEVLDRFIEQHRSDRTLLQKMRDAIRSFIDKVTGKERKRLETAEGKLEAALKAAARETKALQDKAGRDTLGAGKYSLKEDENSDIVRRNQTESEGAGTFRGTSAQTDQASDTGRSRQNRQGVGSEVRSEVGSTVRREDFLREHRERGDRSVSLKNGAIYAYHEATETELNDNARKAVSILKDLGIPCFTTTDGIHIYANGKTRTSSQAVTIRDGSDVKVSISAKMGTEGVSTAYHEAFHFLGDIAPAIRNKLQGIIRESIVKNRSYETFANRIAEGYQIPLDPSQRTKAQEAKFQEELNAYICGEIMAQNPGSEAWNLICEFIPNTDSLYSAVVDMYTDFKTQQKGETKFSLKTDSQGRELSEEQQKFFKDSKVRDESGQLMIMYRGGNEDFTVFDRKKSRYSNLYGRGFYFTDSEAHARQYGNAKAFYLNITTPVSTTETTITREQMRKFLKAVAANEDDFSFENYGYDATVSSVLKSIYGKSDFAMLYDVNQTAIGDMVAAVELFNEVNGTSYDGLILDTETVAFQSNQIKSVANQKPTSDPDIRYSLKTGTITKSYEAALDAAAREAKALQKKSAGDTMGAGKYSLKEDGVGGRENETGRRSEAGGQEGHEETSDREGEERNRRVRREFSASSGRYEGVDPSFGEKPFRTWTEGYVIMPPEGTVSYVEQQTVKEYGVPSFVVSDAAWGRGETKAPAFSVHGQIYLQETIPEKFREMIAPHEITHVMRQVEFAPYLDFVERTPTMLDMGSAFTQKLLEHTANHQHTTVMDADPVRLYDEFNATLYGHIHSGKMGNLVEPLSHVFYDFDAYAKELTELHERFKAERETKALQDKAGRDTMGKGKYSLKEDENNGITEENHRAEKGSGGISESGYNSQQETSDTGRSGQNRQGVGGEVRSEVGSTVRREDFLREHRERGDRSVRLKGEYLEGGWS